MILCTCSLSILE